MSATASAKELLGKVKRSDLSIPGAKGYKEAFGAAFWTVMERVIDDHERLEKQVEVLQESLKVANNYGQLGMSQMKRLAHDMQLVRDALAKLPKELNVPALEDLKGQ